MLKIEAPNPRANTKATGFALWNLGFRPLYLLASIFVALSVTFWVCQYEGFLSRSVFTKSGVARP